MHRLLRELVAEIRTVSSSGARAHRAPVDFLVKGPHGNAPARPRLGGIRKTVRHANARAHRHRTWPHALHAPRLKRRFAPANCRI